MRKSFTDIFIKHPVLAIVVNLVIVLMGWRALTTLPVQQYPKIESSSVVITTVYFGAGAETVRGFLTTPIERSVSAISGVDYIESTSRAGVSTVTVHLKLNHNSTAALAEVTARLQQVRSELPSDAEPPVVEVQRADRPYASFYLSFSSSKRDIPAITDWLADHHVDAAVAGALAETAVTLDALDRIAAAVDGPALAAALRWAAAGCSVRGITADIQDAARRISGLVASVKGFTHMDQSTVAAPVDLTSSLTTTIAVLRAKARSKSVTVTVTVEPDLPQVRGVAGELNQIWANLIDNAIDAVPQSGRVEITARCERQRVVVRVVDNGPGMSAETHAHIFEPFFTTKPVGKGTGLGLDIVRRLVSHNDAEIEVESAPGRTEFRVSLAPVAVDRRGERP